MMKKNIQKFAGEWTEEKLARLQKYLSAYMTALKHQQFKKLYIDAFAGTGYREVTPKDDPDLLLFPELAETEPQKFISGSAKIALETNPPFDSYIFIEKGKKKHAELMKLRDEYPNLRDSIHIKQAEANEAIVSLSTAVKTPWTQRRGVMFLDPYGMQVEWATLKAISATQAIDLWILFPLGTGVARMLTKSGKMDETWENRLTLFFGTDSWRDAFYQKSQNLPLFQGLDGVEKTATFDSIGKYFVERLRTIFPAVAPKPLTLTNSRNNPLYLLCFACANPKKRAQEIALKIANHILKP